MSSPAREASPRTAGSPAAAFNDHPDIRAAFEGFHMESLDISYTVGGGRGAARRELVIWSWDQGVEPAGLF